ncbi:MAG: hypothetical protein ACREPK_01405 [Rhodanobacteraceae bacterium]
MKTLTTTLLILLLTLTACSKEATSSSAPLRTPKTTVAKADIVDVPIAKSNTGDVEVALINYIINSTHAPFTSANFTKANKMYPDDVERSCVAIVQQVESWDNNQVTLRQMEEWFISPVDHNSSSPDALLNQAMSASSSDKTYVPFIVTMVDMTYFVAHHPNLGMGQMINLCEHGYNRSQDWSIKQAANLFSPGHDTLYQIHE